MLKKLSGVLFQPSKAKLRVILAEVKVVGWRRRAERDGHSRGQRPDRRVGGRMPHDADAEFADRTGYDGFGHTYVHHVIQHGCSALLVRREEDAA